ESERSPGCRILGHPPSAVGPRGAISIYKEEQRLAPTQAPVGHVMKTSALEHGARKSAVGGESICVLRWCGAAAHERCESGPEQRSRLIEQSGQDGQAADIQMRVRSVSETRAVSHSGAAGRHLPA